MVASLPGFEPGTFGLEVQRAIHCATGTAYLNHSSQRGSQRGSRKMNNFLLQNGPFLGLRKVPSSLLPYPKILARILY